jgi:hypothetical protein
MAPHDRRERKTDRLVIRIQPSIKAAISALAAKDRRTVAQFVAVVLEDRIAARSRAAAA